jgi:hypothetical protein
MATWAMGVPEAKDAGSQHFKKLLPVNFSVMGLDKT